MNEITYAIADVEYTVYQAASGDYCVSVEKYGEDREDYNLGTYADAMEFILSYYEIKE